MRSLRLVPDLFLGVYPINPILWQNAPSLDWLLKNLLIWLICWFYIAQKLGGMGARMEPQNLLCSLGLKHLVWGRSSFWATGIWICFTFKDPHNSGWLHRGNELLRPARWFREFGRCDHLWCSGKSGTKVVHSSEAGHYPFNKACPYIWGSPFYCKKKIRSTQTSYIDISNIRLQHVEVYPNHQTSTWFGVTSFTSVCRMPSHGMASGRHGMVFQRCHQHFRVETPQKEVVGRYGYPLVNIQITMENHNF